MSLNNEILYDFSFSIPRVIVGGNICILDNVKKIVFLSETQIIVGNGKKFTAISGKALSISEINDERMQIEGEIEKIEFYGPQSKDKN